MPQTAEPVIGQGVTAYGQGADGELRVAHGVVREITSCAGCTAPAYFVFAGNAGPGFSGGPVVDSAGRLIGITFGYRDEGRQRLIYGYAMSRVRTELAALSKR
jgi:S1-C subfamily serine protease